jgi:pantothenate synthetase
LIEARPEPASVAESATVTELVYQPAEQAPAPQVIEVEGAVASAVTANELAGEVRPAPFVAVTDWPEPGSVGVPTYA